jgi:hypothetical protein
MSKSQWKAVVAGLVAALSIIVLTFTTAPITLAQVTSVRQLSDVKPTDWYFQPLQSLVERYGCMTGYPDRTFRPNRPVTRGEFAVHMNACLDQVNELIATASSQSSEEDTASIASLEQKIQALQKMVELIRRSRGEVPAKGPI